MPADELRERLSAARTELEGLVNDVKSRWLPENIVRYRVAQAAVLVLEREVAAALGEEHAIPLDFPMQWIQSPEPRLLCNEHRALLAFRIRAESLKDDAGYEPTALVEFRSYTATRLGGPNDEVHEGHPLSGRGLDAYTAQQVVNSRWVAELEAINKVHHGYRPEYWRDRNHYVFWFRHSTFECIARSFTVEVYRESDEDILARMCQRLRDRV
jgi:hypothetical protein